MNKKFGVIGYGAMGKNHARIYDSLDLLGSVYDSNENTIDEAGFIYDCTTEDLNNLLIAEDLLGVSICTPTETHCSLAKECLSRGISTLIEKPISFSLEEAKELQSFHRELKNNTSINVGYIERFNPVIQALRPSKTSEFYSPCLLCDSVFGDIISVNIKRVGGEPRSATNIIYDLMTHDLDLLTYILPYSSGEMSMTRDIRNTSGLKKTSKGITYAAQALLDIEGISCSLESDWASAIKTRRLEITGTKACLKTDLIKRTIELDFKESIPDTLLSFLSKPSMIESFSIQHKPAKVVLNLGYVEPLRLEIQEFSNFVLTHKQKDWPRAADLQDAINTLELTALVDKECKIV